MNGKIISTFFILFLASNTLFAAEIDQLTHREKYQETARDFTETLNDHTNSMLEKAVANFNDSFDPLEMTAEDIHKRLAFEIYKVTAGDETDQFSDTVPTRISLLYALTKSGHGPVQTWIQSDENKEWWIKLDSNIYDDIFPEPLNKNYIVKVGGEFIGPDKIDHFFDQGYSYWLKSGFGEDDLKALDFGVESEYGWYGLKAGGVFSFADLRANWEGYRFYINLFHEESGHLNLAEDGTVEISRTFDWNEYIDWQYDELKNPSVYTKANMNRICRHIEENYEEYKETYIYLQNNNFFDYMDKRETYYMTEEVDYEPEELLDMRLIMSES